MAVPNATINKAIAVAPDGKRYTAHPNGNPPGGQHVITGSGFGAAPNVVLWRTFEEGTDGQPVSISPPSGEIGDLVDEGSAETMQYVTYKGRKAATGRNNGNHAKLQYIHGSKYTRFRDHIALCVPDSGYMPGSQGYGFRTYPTDSGWKPVWHMLSGDGNATGTGESDCCFPTHTGNGFFTATGNSITWDFFRFIHPSDAGTGVWSWDEFNGFSWMQEADIANPHSVNGLGEMYTTSPEGGTVVKTKTRSAFAETGVEDTITDANAGYDRVKYNALSRDSGGQAQAYYSDMYLAVESSPGANDFRQCLFVGDNATFANCGQLRPVVADSWSDTEISFSRTLGLTYWHVVKPDGSIVSGAIS